MEVQWAVAYAAERVEVEVALVPSCSVVYLYTAYIVDEHSILLTCMRTGFTPRRRGERFRA